MLLNVKECLGTIRDLLIPLKTTPLRENFGHASEHSGTFIINSEPITTFKKASDLPKKSKNTSEHLRTVQSRSKPMKMPQNTFESIRTPHKDRKCRRFFRNLSEPMITPRNASGHAENVVQKTFQNKSKLTNLSQNATQLPLNVRERLRTFRNNSIRLKIYENTQVHLRRPHIVRERIRTFRNLSNNAKLIKTFQNTWKHSQNVKQSFRISSIISEPTTTIQITPECQRILLNVHEPFRTILNLWEHLQTPQNNLKGSEKISELSEPVPNPWVHQNASENQWRQRMPQNLQ